MPSTTSTGDLEKDGNGDLMAALQSDHRSSLVIVGSNPLKDFKLLMYSLLGRVP
jgi:hypothetical protein